MGRIQDRSAENQPLNFYEDFGLPASATNEQIRNAYMTLVQLLHPDQQRDPVLKRAAQIQMQRVNRAYAVLADPERRRQYDTTIGLAGAPDPEQPEARRGLPRVLSTIAWLAFAALGIFGIGWYAAKDPAGAQPTAQVSPPPAAPAPAPAAAPTPVASPPGLKGTWVFHDGAAGTTGDAPSGPESVEVSVAEDQGVLRGHFHGRYRGSDPATPTEIDFPFEGHAHGDAVVLPWKSETGANGELELRLLSENSVEVVWSSAELGKDLPMAARIAVLTRQKEP
jgi:hypothetical protein